MKTFLVFYMIPAAILDGWSTIDPGARQASEERMRGEWEAWTRDHAAAVRSTEVGGRTKRVTAAGVTDIRNDIVITSRIEAESHDAAAALFAAHPHLQIPQSSIEIMELKPMSTM